jgi:glycosyltransferase involved in cell wall biosynthesis
MVAFPERAPSLTTISLPLAIWGTGYAEFLPRWWEGVQSLETEFLEVVIVTDRQNYPAVMKAVTDFSKVRIRVETHQNYAGYWNRAIELCQGKWFAMCNADDQFLPGALSMIAEAEESGHNLLCDTLRNKGSETIQTANWRPEEFEHTFTLLGANPMTKQLWEAAGGFLEGFRFADWGLAIQMHKTGLVRPFHCSSLRIIYDVGYDRPTLSGASLPSEERAKANEQPKDLLRELQ